MTAATALRERLAAWAVLVRLHRPIGILLLLWPVGWALWIAAQGVPATHVALVFVAGTVLMRSAGCAMNDFADRGLDGHVERTRERPLATGRVSPREALGVFTALTLVAGLLVLTLNRLTVALACCAVALAITYPFMKRHTHLPQVVLGLAFGWGVPMAFAAQTGTVPPLGWLLLTATVTWALIYDTEYAMVDRDDDRRLGMKSTAILFGDADRAFIGVFQALMVVNLVLVGREADLHGPYWGGLTVAAALFCWQQALIRERSRDGCFRAFMNNNWVGAAIFAGIALDYALYPST